MNAAYKKKTEAFGMWGGKHSCASLKTEKKTNAYFRSIIREKRTLLSEINRHKLMYFGHIKHRDGNNLEKVIMEGMVVSHCFRGDEMNSWCTADHWKVSCVLEAGDRLRRLLKILL